MKKDKSVELLGYLKMANSLLEKIDEINEDVKDEISQYLISIQFRSLWHDFVEQRVYE